MADVAYSSLTVDVHRDTDAGQYLFGVTVAGVFVTLGTRGIGSFEADIARVPVSDTPVTPTDATPADPTPPADPQPEDEATETPDADTPTPPTAPV